MTTVAVHTFVIDPIWNAESGDTPRWPVALFSRPYATSTTSSSRVGPEAEDPKGRAGHLVPLSELCEAALPVVAVDSGFELTGGRIGMLLDPADDTTVEVHSVRHRSLQDE